MHHQQIQLSETFEEETIDYGGCVEWPSRSKFVKPMKILLCATTKHRRMRTSVVRTTMGKSGQVTGKKQDDNFSIRKYTNEEPKSQEV